MNIKISTYPTNWPMDGRSVTRPVDGKIVIFHPDRKGQEQAYDPIARRWTPWERPAADNVVQFAECVA